MPLELLCHVAERAGSSYDSPRAHTTSHRQAITLTHAPHAASSTPTPTSRTSSTPTPIPSNRSRRRFHLSYHLSTVANTEHLPVIALPHIALSSFTRIYISTSSSHVNIRDTSHLYVTIVTNEIPAATHPAGAIDIRRRLLILQSHSHAMNVQPRLMTLSSSSLLKSSSVSPFLLPATGQCHLVTRRLLARSPIKPNPTSTNTTRRLSRAEL